MTAIGAKAALVVCLTLVAAAFAVAAPPDPAVIAGTVFRDPGFALARAEVSLTLVVPPPAGKAPKALKMLSDGRGEFAFRLPPVKLTYRVTVKAQGFAPQSRDVALAGGPDRADLNFNLQPDKEEGK